MRFGLFITLIIVFILPVAVGAQSLGELGGISGEPFSVSVSPQYPAPYSKATVSLFSGSADLTNATIAVIAGEKEIYRGSSRPFSVQLGKAGSALIVKIIVSYGGASYTRELSIRPQDVVLVAEPISSSPPLYEGKPSVPLDGGVRIVAVANLKDSNGRSSGQSSYSYLWAVDGTKIINSSGIGKSTIIVASPLQYRSRSVSVVVTDPAKELVGGANISLSAIEPSVRIYERDPLLGILYEHSISGSYSIKGAEATLYAAPFSFPTTSGSPLVQWFLNGNLAQTNNFVTLRPSGDGRGNASLSLSVSAGDYSRTTAELSVSFGEQSGFNLFGL
jgi:hypothetical protein